MTPQEITEYKQKWMSSGKSISVPFHSDKKLEATQFCRENFEQKDCWLRKYTDVYEHTMFFEKEDLAEKFRNKFSFSRY